MVIPHAFRPCSICSEAFGLLATCVTRAAQSTGTAAQPQENVEAHKFSPSTPAPGSGPSELNGRQSSLRPTRLARLYSLVSGPPAVLRLPLLDARPTVACFNFQG